MASNSHSQVRPHYLYRLKQSTKMWTIPNCLLSKPSCLDFFFCGKSGRYNSFCFCSPLCSLVSILLVPKSTILSVARKSHILTRNTSHFPSYLKYNQLTQFQGFIFQLSNLLGRELLVTRGAMSSPETARATIPWLSKLELPACWHHMWQKTRCQLQGFPDGKLKLWIHRFIWEDGCRKCKLIKNALRICMPNIIHPREWDAHTSWAKAKPNSFCVLAVSVCTMCVYSNLWRVLLLTGYARQGVGCIQTSREFCIQTSCTKVGSVRPTKN